MVRYCYLFKLQVLFKLLASNLQYIIAGYVFLSIHLFILVWLCWVFLAVHRFSLVVVHRFLIVVAFLVAEDRL